MTEKEIIQVVSEIDFPGYWFRVEFDRNHKSIVIRASYYETDTVTVRDSLQVTRDWILYSHEITVGALVGTCFKCVMTSMEHKTREWFTYKGKPIFNPHQDIDKLLEITEARS